MSKTPDAMNDRPELEDKLSELEILRQSLEDARGKEKDAFDQLVRLTADFQNFRKRSETRIADARREGKADALMAIIALSDALVQAETASRNAKDVESLKKGLSLVRDEFEKFLTDQGLVPIRSKGEKLDPLKHEAIARVVDPELEEGTIVEEIQRGYTLNGQVVRPARVSVSKTNENTEENHHG